MSDRSSATSVECPECKGVGWIILPEDTDPTHDEEDCRTCGGTGLVDAK